MQPHRSSFTAPIHSHPRPIMQTRRDHATANLPDQPLPEISPQAVFIGVSQPFDDQQQPHPIRSSRAKKECFDNVRKCLGEEIPHVGRFTITPTTMVTGALGQEALFIIDPAWPNANRQPSNITLKNLKKLRMELGQQRKDKNTSEPPQQGSSLLMSTIKSTLPPLRDISELNKSYKEMRIETADHSPTPTPIPDPTPCPIPDPTRVSIPISESNNDTRN